MAEPTHFERTLPITVHVYGPSEPDPDTGAVALPGFFLLASADATLDDGTKVLVGSSGGDLTFEWQDGSYRVVHITALDVLRAWLADMATADAPPSEAGAAPC